MAYRFATRVIVALLALLLGSSCAAQGRLYDLCFTRHPRYSQYQYVSYGSFENPRNCTMHPNVWHQEFPVQVVAPPEVYDAVLDMSDEINTEVGKPLLTVRMRHIYETVDRPDDDAIVYVVVSNTSTGSCKVRKTRAFLAYTQYWFRRNKYYSSIVLCNQRLTTSPQMRAVVKHELLHALGLKHSESQEDVMYSEFGPGSIPTRISEEDLKVLRDL